ncbi:alpha/beta fold hydrolase [Planktothrix sp. FACHB-1365]|uniref:alpha/beta fold hydrolase n=1 Tax=Planktothrix sp. FACHB-1365 TaxID=2692855 RepID=UPI00168628BF|nr:alpha/beta hydrolase [Planktothrix sp. FACHB-1365]MBD2481438.1 alpha/beta hydrolase [Planktothrix sp. FACHB-1365]
MFPSFLPQSVQRLTEATSIAFAQNLKCKAISTPLREQPIQTIYIHQGTGGTPILLIHGFDSSSFEYRRLLPLLATEQETWSLDILGFGFTERGAEFQFKRSEIMTHLYSFWETLINQPVILVGASMGGAVALDFALWYPAAVKSIVLLDSAGMKPGPVMGKFLLPPFDYLATEFLRNPKVRQAISESAYFDKSFASLDAQLCAALHLEAMGWNQALIRFSKTGGYGKFGKELNDIQQPTLILWGDNDKILGTADAYKFEKAIPHSQLIWIKNSGHVPHLEQPQITAQHILDFARKSTP